MPANLKSPVPYHKADFCGILYHHLYLQSQNHIIQATTPASSEGVCSGCRRWMTTACRLLRIIRCLLSVIVETPRLDFYTVSPPRWGMSVLAVSGEDYRSSHVRYKPVRVCRSTCRVTTGCCPQTPPIVMQPISSLSHENGAVGRHEDANC